MEEVISTDVEVHLYLTILHVVSTTMCLSVCSGGTYLIGSFHTAVPTCPRVKTTNKGSKRHLVTWQRFASLVRRRGIGRYRGRLEQRCNVQLSMRCSGASEPDRRHRLGDHSVSPGWLRMVTMLYCEVRQPKKQPVLVTQT